MSAQGLDCLSCGAGQAIAKESWPIPEGQRRKRVCRVCGAYWMTTEMSDDTLAQYIKERANPPVAGTVKHDPEKGNVIEFKPEG